MCNVSMGTIYAMRRARPTWVCAADNTSSSLRLTSGVSHAFWTAILYRIFIFNVSFRLSQYIPNLYRGLEDIDVINKYAVKILNVSSHLYIISNSFIIILYVGLTDLKHSVINNKF